MQCPQLLAFDHDEDKDIRHSKAQHERKKENRQSFIAMELKENTHETIPTTTTKIWLADGTECKPHELCVPLPSSIPMK